MESQRAPKSTPETAGNSESSSDATQNKDSKTKKVALPSGVINASLPELQQPTDGNQKTEKDGWNFESLFDKPERQEKAADQEAPDEPLSTEQSKEIVNEYVEDRMEAVESEIADVEEQSPLADIVLANQLLLEKLRDQVKSGQQTVEAAIDTATADTVEELHLDTDQNEHTHDVHNIPARPSRASVQRQEADIATILAPEETPQTSEPTPSEGSIPPQQPPHSEMLSGMDDPGEQPVFSNTLETPFSDDITRELHDSRSSASGHSINNVPQTRVERIESSTRRADVAAGVLVGGVTGYMIGKHVGRKKAEKATKPVHESMAKEVEVLHKKIADNEQFVRTLAAQKSAYKQAKLNKPQTAYADIMPQKRAEARQPETQPNPVNTTSSPGSAKSAEVVTSVAHKSVRPETSVIAAAAPMSEKFVQTPAAQPRQEQLRAVVAIEKLPLEDVLELARDIKVEGKTIESYYKQGQLTETDVRKILTEHRKSGRAERAFYKHSSLRERYSYEQSTGSKSNDNQKATPAPTSSNNAQNYSTIKPTAVANGSTQFVEQSAQHDQHDKLHDDNTRHLGVSATLGIIVVVIFAIFLVEVVFN